MIIDPINSATQASIGMTHHGEGNLDEAIALYHSALRSDSQNTLVQSLLNSALNEI